MALIPDEAIAEIAHSLDCITAAELRALAAITEKTEEAWRKRGTGPAYILFGNAYLYPRSSLAAHLAARSRDTPSSRASLL